ncbi:AMMECR1 domain-containing protein [Pseudomassariella vexata]|uniref:AMMECR1 domain-containing protein n=1 Tax=Pseudomassariella vexata TaxID=1141098 RepID=A0A1Y2DHN4_9PEZI|nr:AMMECR1 domain-containing protein [Pseudomassariella vexata]ORY58763.1 AMMECR1 domain-containing protein [Pseudomassariella vexata]
MPPVQAKARGEFNLSSPPPTSKVALTSTCACLHSAEQSAFPRTVTAHRDRGLVARTRLTMASIEHCLYCFEALAAHLEARSSLTLTEVEKSWADYCNSEDAAGVEADEDDSSTSNLGSLKKRLPAMRRVAASSSSGTSSPSSGSSMSLAPETPGTSTSSLPADKSLITESPLFVTWNIVSPRSGHVTLRGCIGTFESQELDEGLSSYAITSAIHDMRFDPISKRELPSLEVAVTLLTDFEDCEDAMDWELGKHGLRLSFTDRGRRYGSTYLPDVAPEQGWNKEETLVSLMRKAGWMGKKDKWQDVDLKVVRYQGKKDSLRYPEYKQWRDWVDQKSKV